MTFKVEELKSHNICFQYYALLVYLVIAGPFKDLEFVGNQGKLILCYNGIHVTYEKFRWKGEEKRSRWCLSKAWQKPKWFVVILNQGFL